LHAWLAFVIGVLITLGGVLAIAAVTGATFIGLTIQEEVAIAATVFAVSLILVLIFYAGAKAQFRKVQTGMEVLIGSTGIATSNLNPKGEVRVNGEFWQAQVKDGAVSAGEAVTVVGLEGLFLVVQPTERKA
jgi:membrane-bound serine protease (ClpP class)